MTLCIGALAQTPVPLEARIVLCTDFKVATDEFASETEYKLRILSDQLVALVSGRPGRAKELTLIYREYLKHASLDEADIVTQLSEPLRDFKRRLADRYIGRRLGLSYQALLDSGEQWLGTEGQSKYLSDIDRNQLGVQMIIAGLLGKLPVLCELRDDELEWRTNFAVIGSGALTAEPALHARNQLANTPLNQALYNVYEAKKISEASPFVGKKTSMYVFRSSGNGHGSMEWELLSPRGEKALDKLFNRYGPKPMRTWPDLPDGSLLPVFFRPVQ